MISWNRGIFAGLSSPVGDGLPRVLLDRRTGSLFFVSQTTDAQFIVLSCL